MSVPVVLVVAMVGLAFFAGFLVNDILRTIEATRPRPMGGPLDLSTPGARDALRRREVRDRRKPW